MFQNGTQIYTFDTNSGVTTSITNHPSRNSLPYYGGDQALSSDGQFLAFTSDRDHWASETYVLHVASGQVAARLTADFVGEANAVWSRKQR